MNTNTGSLAHEEVPGWAVRLEAKVDVALAQHGAAIDSLSRDIASYRTERDKIVEKVESRIDLVETRVNTIERTPTVTPKGLAAALITSITGLGAFIALLDRLAA